MLVQVVWVMLWALFPADAFLDGGAPVAVESVESRRTPPRAGRRRWADTAVGPRLEKVDPAVLASDDDFWGSCLVVVLYAASHYDSGHVR